jgi:hypothetical protein
MERKRDRFSHTSMRNSRKASVASNGKNQLELPWALDLLPEKVH